MADLYDPATREYWIRKAEEAREEIARLQLRLREVPEVVKSFGYTYAEGTTRDALLSLAERLRVIYK
jgi:hypothetical protein